MGMGFGANFADVMEWDEIKKIVPNEAKALQDAMDCAKIDMDSFCQCIQHSEWGFAGLDNESNQVAKIESCWESLFFAFKKQTDGLELCPMFHSNDDGDRYDDVSGGFFHVEGVYQQTPAGERFASKIERRFYVTFG